MDKNNILSSCDFFGSYLHLYVNQRKKVYTSLGGILTLISFIICITILVFLCNDFMQRENPNTTEIDEINKEFKKIKFNEEKIYIPWSIRNYKNHKLDFSNSIYPVIFYYYGERNKKSNEMHFNYSILNYTLCNQTDLKKYFYSDNISFDDYYCIEWNNLIMGGSWLHDFIYQVEFNIFLCEENENKEEKKCENNEKFSKNISEENAYHIEIYYPEIYFNAKNKKKPIEIFYNYYFYDLDILNTKIERLYLKEFTMIDDQGWLFEKKIISTFWGFDKLESDTYTRIVNNENFNKDFSSSKIYSLAIFLNRNKKIFTRKYPKLLNELGNMLSLISGIFSLFQYLSQFFTEAYQDRKLVNDVFIQKYCMNEKYNEYKKDIRLSFSIQKLINNKEYLAKNEDLKNLLPKRNPSSRRDGVLVARAIFNTEKKGNESNVNDILSSKLNINQSNYKEKKVNNETVLNKVKNNLLSSIDSSKIIIRPSKSNYGLNIKNADLDKIKVYLKSDIKRGINLNENKYNSKDFDFPYYLYLLNIFNKIFWLKKMCCISKKFNDAWQCLVHVFDVVKFIELQTNVDLINKILFELKIEKQELKKNLLRTQLNKDNISVANYLNSHE